MNQYGRQAMEHWRMRAPTRYAQITDPEEFFTTLGHQVADRIATLSAEMAHREPPAGDYLSEVGRLNRIGQQAREIVLAEQVFLTSEPERDPTAPTGRA